ncbi:hypothetical protein BRW65_03940 [Mycobacterium paraffinicum]|uniref:Mu-like prophage I protein n=1 Tax=Mycobacterium paraffinicum TaxID=53378 RepID=A0A1Q4I1D0_9MYCO|nr:hypothetical protein [Mycobacterium paraffinicum]OJZ75696.1 hypothetical protein BRW65_03940 [Mycobacterium paraffinicum]
MALTLEFDDAEAAVLLDRLGLPEDTTDTELVLDTLKDALRGAPLMADTPPSQIAAAAKKHDLEVMDTQTLAALRHDAAEGRKIAAAAKAQKIEAAVDEAVSTGKITAARKQHWVTLCTHDEKMLEVLASVPNETAVPINELGHSIDPADDRADKPAWFY